MSDQDCFYSTTCLRPGGHEGDCHPGDFRTTTPRASDVVLCAESSCPRAAAYGPFCHEHRRRQTPADVQAVDLTPQQIEMLRAQVARDAAPLFLAAMNWIAGQQVQRNLLELTGGEAA